MSIKYSFLCLILICFCIPAYSQGNWNIQYIAFDSINITMIDKEIRLDFKASSNDIINKKVSSLDIRRLLSKNDTVNLIIENKPTQFIESWKFHIDEGSLKEQSLVSIAKKSQIQIREMYLKSINDSSLTIEINLYSIGECDASKTKTNQVEKFRIVIDKSKIKGLLLNITD